MRKEGVLRQRLYNKGKFVDVALYAILKSDQENRLGFRPKPCREAELP